MKPDNVQQPVNQVQSQEHLVRPIDDEGDQSKTMKKTIYGVYIILILLGIGTGYMLAQRSGGTGMAGSGTDSSVSESGSAGTVNNTVYKDSAEGKLEKGGIDGEGTHKLIRAGGPSQTVYLTSSSVDLDQHAGKNVKVWGETFAAEKAGWLMDVGKVEIK